MNRDHEELIRQQADMIRRLTAEVERLSKKLENVNEYSHKSTSKLAEMIDTNAYLNSLEHEEMNNKLNKK